MKEKKHYETPRFSVTQVITEGVFAASGDAIIGTGSEATINAQKGNDAQADYTITADEWGTTTWD